MQNGQPICYASRALTDTETRYAQIEKELLAIVWSCHKFDQYICGRDVVHIDCHHEPLQAVFKMPMHHGIPDVLLTDNRTQISSSEFVKFAEVWKLEHKTSSSHHPKSNGKTQNTIKIC